MLAAATLTTANATADAASAKSYSITKAWHSKLGCVKVSAAGSTTYSTDYYVSGAGQLVTVYKNPTLHTPKIALRLYKSCAKGVYKHRLKMATADVDQAWYYHTCSANPSIGVGAPWSVGVSVTPTCGNKNAAHRSTRYPHAAFAFIQYNSSTKAVWHKKFDTAVPVKNVLCLHGAAQLTVYRGGKSDSVDLDLGRVCAK